MGLIKKKEQVVESPYVLSKEQKRKTFLRDLKRNKQIYLLMLPLILHFLVFKYGPMYGASIAFMDYKPAKGFLASEWVGFKHFITFFKDPYFFRTIRNTLAISTLSLIVGMPCNIIFALLINEIANTKFKKLVQTITYLPHFISLVVICGMIQQFCSSNGVVTELFVALGMERHNMLQDANLFRPIYVLSGVWQGVGWGTILYLSAISSIDQEQYEAAEIDGAGRFAKMRYITLPSLLPVITIRLILNIGNLMSVGYQKTLLLENTLTLEKAEVLGSYVYRMGLAANYPRFSYSTAVGLFESVINIILVVTANKVSRKVQGSGLW